MTWDERYRKGEGADLQPMAFLRTLADRDRRLGVAWYYVPGDDGRPDGRHIEWLKDEAWTNIDAELQAAMAVLPVRTIASLETANIWPKGTLFHREPVAKPHAKEKAPKP